MKKIIVLSAMALALTACGGGGGSKKDNSTSSSVTTSSSAPATSSSTSSSVSSSSSSSSAGWQLVWSDEFNGPAIDTTKWSFEENCWGGGNGEQQCYTNREANAFIADGKLNIVAKKETFTGSNQPEGGGTETATLPYTSARLRTKNLADWTFGRFEIRAKLPAGQGTWPAIWMLPTNSPYGTWASSGEIDIMEAVNLKAPTDEAGAAANTPEARVYGTLHYGRSWPGNKQSGEPHKLPGGANPADDFHTYALEWEEGEIRWYVDGVHYATQRSSGWYSQYNLGGVLTDAPEGAPFDKTTKFHMLLNLAVGGAWAGNVNNKGIDETVFPQTMQVDFVKVYECKPSTITGKGCATIGDSAKLNPGNTRPVLTGGSFAPLPSFTMFGDAVAAGLKYDSYNPSGAISYSEVAEEGRGKVLNVVKTGGAGNVYFNVVSGAVNLEHWMEKGELVFDVKLTSKASDSKLLVKMDSGWPSVSDFTVTLPEVGQWAEVRIGVAELIAKGNSIQAGKADIKAITNIFVVEPSTAMNVSFDNVRLEVK
jgi:beta-glucanase (GH16 family)